MQLVVISGLSGSGKSVALNVLEDASFYCVDNLPATLLGETDRLPPPGRLRARRGHRGLPQRRGARRAAGVDPRR